MPTWFTVSFILCLWIYDGPLSGSVSATTVSPMTHHLYLALQDGFSNDSVLITVNGKQRYHKSGITTNRVISLADSVDIPMENDTAVISVEVSSKQLIGTLTVQVTDTPYVAVNIHNGNRVEMIPSKDSFRYL